MSALLFCHTLFVLFVATREQDLCQAIYDCYICHTGQI